MPLHKNKKSAAQNRIDFCKTFFAPEIPGLFFGRNAFYTEFVEKADCFQMRFYFQSNENGASDFYVDLFGRVLEWMFFSGCGKPDGRNFFIFGEEQFRSFFELCRNAFSRRKRFRLCRNVFVCGLSTFIKFDGNGLGFGSQWDSLFENHDKW